MGRRPCCAKVGLNKGAWSAMEDKVLSDYIKLHGEGKWRDLPEKAGLRRCGKSCRLRWLNYLRPDIRRGNISSEEEDLIVRLHKLLGNRWALIAGRLPGRTDNEIKNYWNTNLRKKVQLNDKALDDHRFSNHVVRTKAFRCTKAVKIPRLLDHHASVSGTVTLIGGQKNSESRTNSSQDINLKGDDDCCADFLSDFDIDDLLLMSDVLNPDGEKLESSAGGLINVGGESTSFKHVTGWTSELEDKVGFGDDFYYQAKSELDGLIMNSTEATMKSTNWSDSDHIYRPSCEGFHDINELSSFLNIAEGEEDIPWNIISDEIHQTTSYIAL